MRLLERLISVNNLLPDLSASVPCVGNKVTGIRGVYSVTSRILTAKKPSKFTGLSGVLREYVVYVRMLSGEEFCLGKNLNNI